MDRISRMLAAAQGMGGGGGGAPAQVSANIVQRERRLPGLDHAITAKASVAITTLDSDNERLPRHELFQSYHFLRHVVHRTPTSMMI